MNKKIKQIMGIVLMMVMIFTLTACGSNESKEKTALDKIKEKGVIVVGNSPDYPPFETINDKGEIVGFDIDMINEVAKKLGVKVEIKQMSFETIITAVQSGQVDIGVSGFSVTPERKKSVDMSNPYLVGGQVIVTTKDSGIKSKEDLKGQKVAAGMGSTCEEAAKTIEGAEVVLLDDFNMGFVMLKNGSVKANVADMSVANDYLEKEKNFVIVGEPLSYEETAVVIKKGNTELTDAINKAIEEVKKEGKIDEFKKKWGIK